MTSKRDLLRDAAVLLYAVLAYGTFLLAAGWAILFLADITVVHTVDGPSRHAAWVALLVDLGLLLLFALQHSVMARQGAKRYLTRVLPAAAERSTYVLAASLALLLLFWQWEPLPGEVWQVHGTVGVPLLWATYALGWTIVVASTFMIDHFDFLGLRQAFDHLRRRPASSPRFEERWFYRWVRHPMMSGLLIAFWATPKMSTGHLLFAAAASAYIAVGLRFEERDLHVELGDVYDDYTRRVPALVPRPRAASPELA